MHEEGCYSCELNSRLAELGLSEQIYRDVHWRVAHAFNSALAGWLVLLPMRHVESPHELNSDETASLGPLLKGISSALAKVTGCLKTYVVMFAEAPGFQHLHFHVIPRMRDLPDEYRGPGIFAYLAQPEDTWISAAERDRVVEALSRHLEGIL